MSHDDGMSFDAKLGFSLAFAYLTGDRQQAFDRLFGPLEAMLATLRQAGVASIEMRAVSTQAHPQAVLDVAKCVWAAGLDLTVHGVLPADPVGRGWPAHYPSLIPLLEAMRRRGQTLMIPLHAYQLREGDRATLAQRSIEAVRDMAMQADREGWPVRIAVELNRAKNIVDPAIDYAGVLAIVRGIDHPRVGLCWDWGHGYANHLNGLLDAQPPMDFLERVIHTHIHDLQDPGKTHWPLTEGLVPVRGYASSLRAAGYAGLWNLELSPQRFEDEPRAAERILQSIQMLREALAVGPDPWPTA